MSNFIIIDGAKGSSVFDLSKFGPMTSINLGEPTMLGADLGAISWMVDNFPAEGVTIDGVTFKLAPTDLSKLAGLDFGNIQLFKSGDPILAKDSSVTLQATSSDVWQVPTADAGSFIELDLAAIDLAGINFGPMDFHTFAF